MNKISLEEFGKLYDATHSALYSDVVDTYNDWIRYQEYYEATPKEEKTKDKLVIWNDYPTAESWIEYVAEENNRKEASRKTMDIYMKLPWYERILTEEGNCKIKDNIIEAFFTSKEGIQIRHNLLYWHIPSESLFDAIKHFAPFVTDRKFTDDEIKAFLVRNKNELDSNGIGVSCDGSRVLRTLKWACEMFYEQMV
jgi:hypothetical protein